MCAERENTVGYERRDRRELAILGRMVRTGTVEKVIFEQTPERRGAVPKWAPGGDSISLRGCSEAGREGPKLSPGTVPSPLHSSPTQTLLCPQRDLKWRQRLPPSPTPGQPSAHGATSLLTGEMQRPPSGRP